ncbi:MAG: family 20 glycosylhydrolase [Bacteroidales bacterium]
MRHTLTILIFTLFASPSFSQELNQGLSVVPQPVDAEVKEGSFSIKPSTKLLFYSSRAEDKELLILVEELLKDGCGHAVESSGDENEKISGNILLQLNQPESEELGTEGYSLDINEEHIVLRANTTDGLFYGAQSLWQLLTASENNVLPCAEITDYPRFEWRGMHLDVSRHFFPVDFIYKYIDYLAMHKMNIFHWHLVDDQAWRIEIKKYPKLTEVGAWRADREDLDWELRGGKMKPDEEKYGGFYTQEQVKSVVEYARKKHVTVIPEIEMPAHVMSALAAYPEYSCSGEYQDIPAGAIWPITHIFCAGKDETFTFLENVLDEVMGLFPSTYIHIGGDEATKTEWEKCERCQARMETENLDDEHELQAYFIKRIEKYLNAHGRKLIGWDEILEGGLDLSATIMSWRGAEPGTKAAKLGHDVVMSPTSNCYFDYYQGSPELEPKAFGGSVTLRKVYDFEPVPEELNAIEAKRIIGGQANLWTEQIKTPEHASYMVLPRMTALSEVLWSPKDTKNWASFSKRMEVQYKRFDNMDANYATSAFQVNAASELNIKNRTIKVGLHTEAWKPEIRYTLDGKEPTASSIKYERPFEIKKTSTIKAVVVKDGRAMSKASTNSFFLHKAIACAVKLKFSNSKHYNSTGEFVLVDGIKGGSDHSNGRWKGFNGDDMVATIDLGVEQALSKISVGTLQNTGAWIFHPSELVVEVSKDGENFNMLDSTKNKVSAMGEGRSSQELVVEKKAKARYVRVTAKNLGTCPKGHAGEGKAAWLFVDEITVE